MDKNQKLGILDTLCIEFPLSIRNGRLFAKNLIALRNILSPLVAMNSSKERHDCFPEHARATMARNVRRIKEDLKAQRHKWRHYLEDTNDKLE